MPLHGAAHTINGSGYGTRSVNLDNFDQCTGSSPGDLWNDYIEWAYSSGFHSVPMPHSKATKYAIAQALDANLSNRWLSHNVSGLSGTKKIFACAYRRVDPNWGFGASCDGTPNPDDDNNFKYFGVSAGGSWFANPYWYHDQTQQKCNINATWGDNFFSSGSLGDMPGQVGSSGGSGAQAEDPWFNWVKFEYRITLHASAGTLKYLLNNVQQTSQTGINSDDAGGTTRAVWIGGYSRQRDGSNDWDYMADIAMVVGPDAWKRVMLANHATYASATITEFQKITSWANTAIGITVNQGAVPDGSAWLHVFDENDNIIDTQAVTLGEEGGGAGRALHQESVYYPTQQQTSPSNISRW